jgi:hypothetical protein
MFLLYILTHSGRRRRYGQLDDVASGTPRRHQPSPETPLPPSVQGGRGTASTQVPVATARRAREATHREGHPDRRGLRRDRLLRSEPFSSTLHAYCRGVPRYLSWRVLWHVGGGSSVQKKGRSQGSGPAPGQASPVSTWPASALPHGGTRPISAVSPSTSASRWATVSGPL